MSFLKPLLLPFTWLYNFVTKGRNYLYDIGHKPSFKFDSVVISVGNLNVGGSGKTPMIEYLVRLLEEKYRLAILSRGYGRKTKGFRLASDQDDALTLGDEPYQYYRKFGERVKIAVGEERALAIPTILNETIAPEIILLDDAFQHRSVVPQFSILLTDYAKPFYQDFVLPFGRLRESRRGASRADVVVVTKCNEPISGVEEMTMKIKKYIGEKPVFFSGLQHKDVVPFLKNNLIGKKIILVSGIANSSSLKKYASSNFELIEHVKFEDHHAYSTDEIKKIEEAAQAQGVDSILTTEKDMVKLISEKISQSLNQKIWFYLPIETAFINCGVEFDTMVLQMVESKLKELS